MTPARQRAVVFAFLIATGGAIVASNREAFSFAVARATGTSRTLEAARARLKKTLPQLFAAQKVAWPPAEVFLRAIKERDDGSPGEVELWARDPKAATFTLIKRHPICALSGVLGPKRKQGDRQIPEGFYTIEKLNPFSSYHLSLAVDYPNDSDKIRGRALLPPGGDLGDEIMVHGNCLTIGCIPLQDEPIEEVYLAADSVFGKQPVRIHIFPRRLDEASLNALLATTTDATLQGFWRELAVGYQAFESTKRLPQVSVAKDGSYVVRTP